MTSATCVKQDPARAEAPAAGSVGVLAYLWLSALVDRAETWAERARTRRQLAELDDRMLSDIGLSRTDAHRESGKAFWTA